MIENIKEIMAGIQGNQLLIALMGGGIFYQLLSNIKSILDSIWSATLACISFTVNSVNLGDYDTPALTYKIVKVLSESKVLWERHTEIQPSSSDYSETHLVNSAYGRSYRWIWGHLMILDRNYSTQSTKVVVTITARVFFARRKKFIAKLMKAIEECSLTDNRDTIIVNMGKGITTEKPKRSINSIYSNEGIPQKILEDVKAFLDSREIYINSNSPYKFVALLSGTPGSGKTSVIHAIASELSMGVRFINTDEEEFEDIARIMTRSDENNIKRKNIIVLEDVDCMSMYATDKRNLNSKQPYPIEDDDTIEMIEAKKEINKEYMESEAGKESMKASPLSLTSILNLLDGIITPSGTIVFLTSNKPEKLDPALLRDGRIDAKYHFENFNKETANKLVNDYLGFTIPDVKDDITPSSLQRDVLKVKIGRMSVDELKNKYSRH